MKYLTDDLHLAAYLKSSDLTVTLEKFPGKKGLFRFAIAGNQDKLSYSIGEYFHDEKIKNFLKARNAIKEQIKIGREGRK